MKWMFTFFILLSLGLPAQAQGPDLFTAILKDYVKDNGVDYKNLSHDPRLQEYIKEISAVDPDKLPSREAKFAFWLNVYNAYSLKIIRDHYPIRSLDQLNFGGLVVAVLLKKTVWDRPFVKVHGRNLTLRAVDHEILRPQFKDPRITFTIACGAVSCAPILNEAYDADKINDQLEFQAWKFFNDPRWNSFDLKNHTAYLSTLLKFSMEDFGGTEPRMLSYISQFLPQNIASSIRANPSAWKIQYGPYDLKLNDTALNSVAAPTGSSSLVLRGSGLKRFFGIQLVMAELYMPKDILSKDVFSDCPKRLEVTYLQDVPKGELQKATANGIRANVTVEEYATLGPKVQAINDKYTDVHKGDKITIVYTPQVGLRLAINQEDKGIVAGDDIAKAFFAIWVGDHPVDSGIKVALLGTNK